MILLDGRVVAEPLRLVPARPVVDWLNAQAAETLYITALGIGDLLRRLDKLPARQRQGHYGAALVQNLLEAFAHRVLPFDEGSARIYAELLRAVRRRGQSISREGAQVAAIALQRGLKVAVATADSAPYVTAGLVVFDPWYR